MKRLVLLASSIAALAVALSLAAGASAFPSIPSDPGNPLLNGCPAGFEAIQVSDFPSQYRLPARLDNPANGGNGDGTVCGKPVTLQEQAARFPDEDVLIFDFRDNTLTPSH